MVAGLGLLLAGGTTVADSVPQARAEFPPLLIAQAGEVDPDGGPGRVFGDRAEASPPGRPDESRGGATTLREGIREIARATATRFGVDPLLVEALIWVESSVRPGAMSAGGARGLMQLVPGTAERFGVEDALDPAQNIEGGVRYLSWLLRSYTGSVPIALAAYNAGEPAVDRHGGIPPYAVTRTFLQRVLTRYREAGGESAPRFEAPLAAGSRSRAADEECRPVGLP